MMIDIYVSKGQVIARLWPTTHLRNPSPAYQRTIDAVVREREIEKFLQLDDVMAYKLRAAKSRYNWWEVLGKTYISHEYHHPGKSVAIRITRIKHNPHHWDIRCNTDKPCVTTLCVYPRVSAGVYTGHGWHYSTHREAGYENTLRGIEGDNPIRSYPDQAHDNEKFSHVHLVGNAGIRTNDAFIITATALSTPNVMGKTGVYIATPTTPWWLDAPL